MVQSRLICPLKCKRLLTRQEAEPRQTPAVSLPFQNVFSICFRIYNNLPEVRRKKEEQKKRVILQSNRLRAEVFKKVTARRPAGVTCVWCPDAESELDVSVSASPAITGPAPSKERGVTTGCPTDPLPGPGMTSNAG